MSRTVTTNLSDTRETMTLECPTPQYSISFRTLSENASESTISNMSSPLALPNKMRSGYSSVSNVYKGTGIDVGLRSPQTSGYSVLFQNQETWSVSDVTGTGDTQVVNFLYALPQSCHIVVKGINDSNVTVTMIKEMIARTAGAILGASDSELTALLRGSINPTK